IDPRRKLEDACLKVDDLTLRLNRTLMRRILRERQHLEFWDDRLGANNPIYLFNEIKLKLDKDYYNLFKTYKIYIKITRVKLQTLMAKLQALNPLAILARGYSITRTIPTKTVVKDPGSVSLNQDLEITVALGRLYCRVKGKSSDG
ncbi:MAG: exodeoxyribonuclease VII large subunit, partial [Desulfobacterales bacterium]